MILIKIILPQLISMEINPSKIEIKEYDYNLPVQQIAEFPISERDTSRLLVYQNGDIKEDIFKALPNHLPQAAALIVNDTRVIEARILFQKSSGGTIEIFCLEPVDENIQDAMLQTNKAKWRCFIGGASKWKSGELLQKELIIKGEQIDFIARYIKKEVDSFIVEFSWSNAGYSFAKVLHAAGSVPLPPYIKRKAIELDGERYQTIFAQHQGSVAAPTAALHFTETVFENVKAKNIEVSYITLHVGAGTFKPVKSETIDGHQMHAEQFHVSLQTLQQLSKNENIIAVGTTSLRTLESLYWMGIKLKNNAPDPFTLLQWEAYKTEAFISYKESISYLINYLKDRLLNALFCQTSLLIIPGYQFKSARGLVTNFHQPKSTLLLLVSAFIGEDWKKVYSYALSNNFRFLSYGDSSLLWRGPSPALPEGKGVPSEQA